MFELQGWDFLHCVCFNTVHKEPIHFEQTWCHDPHISERNLSEREQQTIDERKDWLIKGLSVTQTNWELIGEVFGFLSGGYNPEIRERIKEQDGITK